MFDLQKVIKIAKEQGVQITESETESGFYYINDEGEVEKIDALKEFLNTKILPNLIEEDELMGLDKECYYVRLQQEVN